MSKFDDALQAYREAVNTEAVASVKSTEAYDHFQKLRGVHNEALIALDNARDALLDAAADKEYPGTVKITDGVLELHSDVQS